MEELIRLIVSEKGRTRAASFYISILIAYLESAKWSDAKKILTLLGKMKLLKIERYAVAYLSTLTKSKDIKRIRSLSKHLRKGKG